MRIGDFKKLIELFSDPGSDFEFENDQIITQVDGNLIEIKVQKRDGDVVVIEDGESINASSWFLKNLARVDLLCSRILLKLKEPDVFIPPTCSYQASLEVSPEEIPIDSTAEAAFEELISTGSPMETTVIYLTSDAGEGKTTLIQHLARTSANKFKDHKGKYLIVPISLGGRPFIGFDDLVVGTLLNHFRFGYYYYGAFLELVRMGLIIPAFDGFEEMFVIKGGGEASSALGALVQELQSEGTVILSARRAYFDYQNLTNQSRLLESFGNHCVGFARVSLNRWDKDQFITFFTDSGFNEDESDKIYNVLSDRVGSNSALLTRPVFVQKLAYLAEATESYQEFLRSLAVDRDDPFEPLINGILNREAHSKWLYQDNDASRPLLSVSQHEGLLADIAAEMWESNVTYLNVDVLEVVAEIYGEREGLNTIETSQAKERIKGHALLIPSSVKGQIQFDHDEFRWYFLAEALVRMSVYPGRRGEEAFRLCVRKGTLPNETIRRFGIGIKKLGGADIDLVMTRLQNIVLEVSRASYSSENSGKLVISIVHGMNSQLTRILKGFAFMEGALRDIQLYNVEMHDCFFSPSSMGVAVIENCKFVKCHFSRLEINSDITVQNTELKDCDVDGIIDNTRSRSFFEINEVTSVLIKLGFNLSINEPMLKFEDNIVIEEDFGCQCIHKLVRIFTSSNHLSENLMQMKFGPRARNFADDILPRLVDNGLLEQISSRGKVNQKHFRLLIKLNNLDSALKNANGSFEEFLKHVAKFETE